MSDLLTLGSSAIQVYQRALSTVGNNIANVNTEGYSRQEVDIGQSVSREVGGLNFGTGAKLDAVRRMFDAFAEVSLRTSISNLNTQAPLVDYASRTVDVLGDTTAGLAPAMDAFFAGAIEMTQDPASRILRDRFLRGAEDLAARFGEINTQIDSLELETRGAITREVDTLTLFARQLATLNVELNRKISIDRQPPELLDRRDSLLREMSKIARLNVTEAPNGAVTVSLTDSSAQGIIVDGVVAREVSAVFDERNPGKVDIMVDPRGAATLVSGVRSGALGGLMTFREQVLQPTLDAIDFLALAMAREINEVHRAGVDYNGNVGKDLFAIDPVFSVVSPAQRINVSVNVEVTDPAAVRFRDVSLTYDGTRKVWIAVDAASGSRTLSEPVTGTQARLQINGLDVRITGTPVDSESFLLRADNRPATGLRVAIKEPFEVAAADLFRAVRGDENLGSANASVRYDPTALPPAGALPIDQLLANNSLATRQVEPRAIGAEPDSFRSALVAAVPAGFNDLSLFLQSNTSGDESQQNLQIQIFTRDGRHLLGNATPPPEELLSANASAAGLGFNPGASYSDAYLNRSDTRPYLDFSLFYGVRAQPVVTGEFEAIDPSLPASGLRVLPDGALIINGRSLGPLDLAEGSIELQASDVANWINGNQVPGVSARAENLIKLSPGQIDGSMPLRLNGVDIDLSNATSPSAQVSALNARSADSGVRARLNLDGSIDIETIGGGNLYIEPEDNAFGLQGNRVFTGTLRLDSLDRVDIRFGRDGTNAGGDLIDISETLSRLGIGVVPARIESAAIPAVPAVNGQSVMAAGALVVNGTALSAALAPSSGNELQAFDVAKWLNDAGIAGVSAQASTSISIERRQINLAFPLSFSIGGDEPVSIPETAATGTGWQDVAGLVSAINSQFDQTGLSARLGSDGNLLLEQVDGKTVTLSTTDTGANALGVAAETRFRGSYSVSSSSGPLQITFGDGGAPRDLARIGLRTTAEIDGAVSEDLLVFVTGPGTGAVSAEYRTGTVNAMDTLRARPFDIRFSSETRYSIVDVATGTVLAEREFNFGNDQSIQYRGLVIELDARPRAGERFRIDGNQDGIGSNSNIKRIADLQSAGLLAGGLTFGESYQQAVSVVGNQTRQATLAQDALKVVNEQATAARDRVSGVNLDEEAANLVRFQQAFQAAARVIQAANQMFDAILQLR